MALPKIKVGFVGFGEVNSPRELIERSCLEAQQALVARGLEVFATAPVSDDPAGRDEARAQAELARADFDVLVVCLAGWIPSHSVIDVISPFSHKPMVLWGLTGKMAGGRLVTAAAQAGTSALREPMEALGFRFKYVYDTRDAPLPPPIRSLPIAGPRRPQEGCAARRVGMMGYRDMKLHATLADGVSLRRVVGAEIEVFESLEIVRRMEAQEPARVAEVADAIGETGSVRSP